MDGTIGAFTIERLRPWLLLSMTVGSLGANLRPLAGSLVEKPEDSDLVDVIRAAFGREDSADGSFALREAQDAWGILFQRYRDRIDAFARWKRLPLKSSETLTLTRDEFANEVYLRVWNQRKLRSYAHEGRFHSWFSAVLSTIFIDIQRERKIDPVDPKPGGDGGDQDPASLRVPAIEGLPDPYRVTYKLTHLLDCELTHEDREYITKMSGLSVAEVNEKLRELYHSAVAPRAVRVERRRDRCTELHARIRELEWRRHRMAKDLETLQQHSPAPAGQIHELREKVDTIDRRMATLSKTLTEGLKELERATIMPARQVAALLRTTPENVYQRLTRARRELRARLSGRPT
jgi:DNA-directed RNA polymerase specialized sigma24 family protein